MRPADRRCSTCWYITAGRLAPLATALPVSRPPVRTAAPCAAGAADKGGQGCECKHPHPCGHRDADGDHGLRLSHNEGIGVCYRPAGRVPRPPSPAWRLRSENAVHRRISRGDQDHGCRFPSCRSDRFADQHAKHARRSHRLAGGDPGGSPQCRGGGRGGGGLLVLHPAPSGDPPGGRGGTGPGWRGWKTSGVLISREASCQRRSGCST